MKHNDENWDGVRQIAQLNWKSILNIFVKSYRTELVYLQKQK